MNLSQEINDFIENYEYPNFKPIKFGEVLKYLVKGYDLSKASEEECVQALEDLKYIWIAQNYVQKTTSASTLLFHLQMSARTLVEVDEVINDRFEIFEKTVVLDHCFENRLTITYYRTPAYCDKRHYIEVVLLIETDNKIKKILNVEKGCL